MPPIETFIELETQLGKILNQRWNAAVVAAWPAIKATWDAGNHDTAIQLVGGLQVGPLHTAQDRRIRALCTAMLAYGAQHVSEKEAAKVLAPDADLEPIDWMVKQLTTLSEQDTPAFAVRVLQAEARRQTGATLSEADTKVLTEQEKFEAFLGAITKDDIGPSSYAARNVIMNGGRWSSDLTANLTTSRMVNYGSLNAMRNVGIRLYKLRATMDQKTSPICDSMNGKVFHVADGFDILGRALQASDGNVLRVEHPWIPWQYAENVRTMSEAQLRARRWVVPPFHPRCRTIIVPAGRQTRQVQAGAPVSSVQPGAVGTLDQHPMLGATEALATETSLPLFDLIDGGGIMRALRGVSHMLPLHSWEIDALGDLIGQTLTQRAVAGRVGLSEAEAIVANLVTSAVPPGAAEGVVLDAVLAEIRAGVGNEFGLSGGA